jgi:predicted esterase
MISAARVDRSFLITIFGIGNGGNMYIHLTSHESERASNAIARSRVGNR